MLKLNLTVDAEKDLAQIARYTLANFGQTQAQIYYQGLVKVFEILCQHPQLGQSQAHIRSHLRRFVHQHHSIYYQVHSEQLNIIRVLNKRQDPLAQFADNS